MNYPQPNPKDLKMKRITCLAAIAVLFSTPLPALAAPTKALMYKNPSCTCCEMYAAYLEQNDFEVEIKPTNDLTQIAAGLGVPPDLQGCHTVLIGGFTVDGFVPVEVIRKMLAESPAITGISLPGMPMGSPGMGGTKMEPFTVYAFLKGGAEPTVYAVN